MGTSCLVLFVGWVSVLQFPHHPGDHREEAWMRVKNRRPILFGGKKYDQLFFSLLLSLPFALGLCVLRQSWNGSPWHRAASLFVTTAALTQLFPVRARRYLVPFDRWIWGLFSCSQIKAVTEQRCLKAVMWLRSAPIPVVLSVSACRQCYPQIQAYTSIPLTSTLAFGPFWAPCIESQGDIVEISPYEMGHPCKNRLYQVAFTLADVLWFCWRFSMPSSAGYPFVKCHYTGVQRQLQHIQKCETVMQQC